MSKIIHDCCHTTFYRLICHSNMVTLLNKGSLTALARETGTEGVGTVRWTVRDAQSLRLEPTTCRQHRFACIVPNSAFKRVMPESCGAARDWSHKVKCNHVVVIEIDNRPNICIIGVYRVTS